MGGIGVTVENGAFACGVIFEHLGHLVADQCGTNGEIPRCDPLGHRHHVWFDAPMPRTRPITCAAKPCDYLVRDHQNTVAITDIAHQFHETGVWHDDAARALDRFHDKGGNGVCPLECDFILETLGDQL